MSVDFFNPECVTQTIEPLFGICDNDNKLPAYLDTIHKDSWIATVINDEQKDITFTAVDNCIEVLRENGDMESRCDVMMVCGDCLYLAELKSKVSDWRSQGVAQLGATISTLKNEANAFYYGFRRREAYVANRRHPHFNRAETDDMERFRDVHKARLYLQATINVK